MVETPSSSRETYDDSEDGMQQRIIPDGEYPRVSDFTEKPPYHHIITPGYKPYREACKRASDARFGMMNEEKDRGTFDPNTFVMEVWQKSPVYQETERLWEVYSIEAKAKLQGGTRKEVGDVLESAA